MLFSTFAFSSFALSMRAAILFVSIISFFSNSEACLTSGFISLGFCFFLISSFFSSCSLGSGIRSGFSLAFAAGGACSDTTLFSSSFTFSITFLALGAKGILVLSEICISSTDIIGGKSIGSLIMKGRLNIVNKIMTA